MKKSEKKRGKGRTIYRQENVTLDMNKNLIGVGDPQLKIKDLNVNLFYVLMCETLNGRNFVPIITYCVCVFLDVIYWFRVIISYNMCKGK